VWNILKLIKKNKKKNTEYRLDDPQVGDLVTLIDIGTADEDEASIGVWNNKEVPRIGGAVSQRRKAKNSICSGRFKTKDVAILLELEESNSSAKIITQDRLLGWVCSNWLKKIE
jgi:hypothetical protein